MKDKEKNPEGHYFSKGNVDKYAKYWGDVGKRLVVPREQIDARYTTFYGLLPKGSCILEAGCGTGRLVKRFKAHGFKVVGIDYSEEMVRKARELVPDVEFLKMDVTKLEFKDNTFEGVMSFGVIVHIDSNKIDKVFSETRRVLKPNGILFLATRSAAEQKRTVEEAGEGGEMAVYYYTLKTIKERLEKCGFEIIKGYEMADDVGRPFNYMYIYARAVK